MTDGEPETAVSASLQKIKSIKNQHKHFIFILYFIKSKISDSFVNYFDGYFAYLKTLDFYFKVCRAYQRFNQEPADAAESGMDQTFLLRWVWRSGSGLFRRQLRIKCE